MITACMYIHNEKRLLAKTKVIKHFYKIKANEYLFLLDRCNDGSYKTIMIQTRKHDYNKIAKCRFILLDSPTLHKFRPAYLMQTAITKSNYKYVLISGADIILDYNTINEHIHGLNYYGAISFKVKPYTLPETLNELIFKIKGGFHGVFAFDKSLVIPYIYNDLLNTMAEDTAVWEAIKKLKPVKVVNSDNWHLRPLTLKGFLKSKLTVLSNKEGVKK